MTSPTPAADRASSTRSSLSEAGKATILTSAGSAPQPAKEAEARIVIAAATSASVEEARIGMDTRLQGIHRQRDEEPHDAACEYLGKGMAMYFLDRIEREMETPLYPDSQGIKRLGLQTRGAADAHGVPNDDEGEEKRKGEYIG